MVDVASTITRADGAAIIHDMKTACTPKPGSCLASSQVAERVTRIATAFGGAHRIGDRLGVSRDALVKIMRGQHVRRSTLTLVTSLLDEAERAVPVSARVT